MKNSIIYCISDYLVYCVFNDYCCLVADAIIYIIIMELKPNHNPESLYEQCVMCYVKNLRQDVRTMDEMNGLQQLPPIILADIYLIVSLGHYVF